jgi:hypothetical protein
MCALKTQVALASARLAVGVSLSFLPRLLWTDGSFPLVKRCSSQVLHLHACKALRLNYNTGSILTAQGRLCDPFPSQVGRDRDHVAC